MDIQKIKNITIVVIVILVLFFGYNWFIGQRQTQIGLAVVSSVTGDVNVPKAALELLIILNDLKKIKLDVSIFNDPAYLGLKDFSVNLLPQPQGRSNPFAPLE